MEEEHQCWGEEREDCLAMQQMLANAVGGDFAAIHRYTNNEEASAECSNMYIFRI
jgi:hypothetical protein